jgi:hypothetical protein
MPFYSKALTLPANTPADGPVEAQIGMSPGIVTYVALQFPAGCAGLAHARILRSGSQVWPGNINSSFAANNYVLSWTDDYDLMDLPHSLTLQGWNLDDTFPHTLTLYVALQSADKVKASRDQLSIFDRLRRYIGS